jgi:hypothetical protein
MPRRPLGGAGFPGYDACTVWGPRLRRGALAVAVVGGSQLGHALVYLARYGVSAGAHQSSGAHAYFPVLTAVLSGAVGGVLTVALLLLAAAHTMPRPALWRRRPTVRYADLLPLLFLAQLAVFMGQEVLEALASGASVPSAIELLFWGTLGQLPAAALVTAVACWLLARIDAAWAALLVAAAEVAQVAAFVGLQCSPAVAPAADRLLASAFPAAFRKRGPPLPSSATAVS